MQIIERIRRCRLSDVSPPEEQAIRGKQTIDERGRGVTAVFGVPVAKKTCASAGRSLERHRDICMQRVRHTILSFGLSPKLSEEVERQWKKINRIGQMETMYAATNPQEFFAELTMWLLRQPRGLWKAHTAAAAGRRVV